MNTTEHYEPARASDRTERQRLFAIVTRLEKHLADVEARSEDAMDLAYMRTANRLRKQINTASEKVEIFDAKYKAMDMRRKSNETATATKAARAGSVKFERALLAFASATAELKQLAATLADELQVPMDIWPSRQSVDTTIRGRIIEILGSKAGVKLETFGSAGRKVDSITSRFESREN